MTTTDVSSTPGERWLAQRIHAEQQFAMAYRDIRNLLLLGSAIIVAMAMLLRWLLS